MANKLALTAALLAALVTLAAATTYTTTVTTTTFEDSEQSQGQSQQCRRQVQDRQFQSCQRYLTSSQRGRRGQGDDEIEMITEDNPRQQEEEQRNLRQCCEQLRRNVDRQCRCEAIRHAVRQSQQGGSYQGEQMQQVYQKARNLPQRCQMRSPERCEIRAIFL